jgi:uncharacterized protein CbrC (UPF0167 family)
MAPRKPDIRTGNLEFAQKLEIIKYRDSHSDISYDDIAIWCQKRFNLEKAPNKSTISRIITNRSFFEDLPIQNHMIRRKRIVKSETLETALAHWVLQKQHQRISLSAVLIQEKGRQFARSLGIPETELKCSGGWVQRFCKRHGFRSFQSHGESGDAQMEGIDDQLDTIRKKIEAYDLADIYNMDETGLFYNMSPDKTIAQRQIEGSKKDKTRITIAFICNADGSDRFMPLFIGRAGKPRCFQKKTGAELGFFYLYNPKAWMTGPFFESFLRRFSIHVKRKVLLIIDNAPSHIWDASKFPNIEILPLPPNTTSKLQPMDAGIIASFKRHYHRKQLAYALDAVDAGAVNPYKISQLQAMRWSIQAWTNLDQSVLVNCWKHTGLLSHLPSQQLELQTTNDLLNDTLATEYNRTIALLGIQNAMSFENFLEPPNEDEFTQEFLTDDEILELAQVDENEDSDQELAEQDIPPLYHDLSQQEKIVVLAKAIAIIEAEGADGLADIAQACEGLRKAQRNLRWKVTEANRPKFIQPSIMQFFS